MVTIKKHVEQICFHCRYYEPWWISGQAAKKDGAKCRFWDKIFPNSDAWAYNPERKKPGERTCKKWEG